MSEFLQTEVSLYDGSPRELYLFSSASFDDPYAYAAGDESITYNSVDYIRETIGRSAPEISRGTDTQNLSITMPRDNLLVANWVAIVPPKTVFLTIYRYHQTNPSETVAFWQGRVRSVAFNTDGVELTCQPIDTAFSHNGLIFSYGGMCQLDLYGSRCRVNPNDFKEIITVGSVSGNFIVSEDFHIFPSDSTTVEEGWWTAGFIERTSTQELRYIASHTTVTIEVVSPFNNLQPGETLNIYAGCAHNTDACLNKFNNIINYLGFPFVPANGQNPFETKLDIPS